MKKKKNKKILEKKIIKIFNLIKKKIKGKIQINFTKNKEINIKTKNKIIENIEIKNNINIEINVYKNYKKITTIINNFNKKTIKNCIKYIKNNIKYSSKDLYNILPKNNKIKKKKKNIGIIFNDNISIKKMINILKKIEKKSLKINKNIIIDNTIFSKNKNIFIIYNNKKKIKKYSSKLYLIIHNIIIKKKNIMENNYEYILKHKLIDLMKEYKNISKKITKKIKYKTKQNKINTKKLSVIFNNNTSIEIFNYLIESIKANNIYNKTSFMYKKLKKKILPSWINIIENPFLYKGIGSKPFDNDGLNTYKYYVIKNGILKTWILNFYYSKKLNLKNTCNSGGIHNWVFKNKKNNINFNKIIKIMKNGIIIDKLLGQGVNITTGFYSKGISGFLIKNCKIKYYINEATISGNLIDLYKNIKETSNDINKNSNIRCGSILVKNIQISGK